MRQIKSVLVLIVLIFSQFLIGQDYSNSWTGYFSYLDIKDITQGNSKVFGAAENAIFIYDTQTNEIETLSTINGLSGETISNIHYVEENGLLLIGFESGLLQLYIESSQEFKTVVDILDKATIPSDKKRINHFNIYNGFAYISTNYGISLYDINNLEFGDTYFIGANGSQIEVNQLTVFENTLYAATETAIFTTAADNPNLIDFEQWTSFANGNWVGIQAVNNRLFVANNNTLFYEIVSNTLNLLDDYVDLIQDVRSFEDKLIVTTLGEVHIYNTDSFTEIALFVPNEEFETKFSSAIITEVGDVFIGTKKQDNIGSPGFGILKTTINDTETFEEVHPESPLSNRFFQISYKSNQLWAVHGGHSTSYSWNGSLRRSGISRLVGNQWRNISLDTLSTISDTPWHLSYIAISPFNPNEIYVSSFFSGVIEIKEEALALYDQDNSTIIPFAANFHLCTASSFDPFGDLWVTTSRINPELNKFSNGTWNSYSLQSVIDPASSNLGFSSLAFDTNNSVFMGSHNYGLVGFKENNGNPIIKNIDSEEDNVPAPSVKSVVIDKQNQLWFATDKGIRVIFNTDDFFEDPDFEPSEIIILDDGTPRELFFQQYVTDIEVDGANNKWFGTLDTGAYYLSSDGQETIYQFTKDNSPLPSNDVLDIEIDNINGLIYFATDKGLVSFNSETSVPENDLQEAYVYPNPVRPNFNINDKKIKIKGITENVNIKITDIEGNLVTEAESRTNTKFSGYNLEIDGGTALWNGKNMSGRTVATGIYMVMISDLDSFETTVLKLMVVR